MRVARRVAVCGLSGRLQPALLEVQLEPAERGGARPFRVLEERVVPLATAPVIGAACPPWRRSGGIGVGRPVLQAAVVIEFDAMRRAAGRAAERHSATAFLLFGTLRGSGTTRSPSPTTACGACRPLRPCKLGQSLLVDGFLHAVIGFAGVARIGSPE